MASKVIDKLKEYTLPILFAISIACLGYYYTNKWSNSPAYNNHPEDFKEVFGWGLAILSSGIFLAVLKWFQFMGFFREELQRIISSSEFDTKLEKTLSDVVYSDEFLKKQNDLTPLWKRVNKALFQNEFSKEIADNIEEKIQELFFRNEKLSHHYRNMVLTVTVSLENDFIVYREISECKVVRGNKDKFKFDFKFMVNKCSEDDEISGIEIKKIAIEGKDIPLDSVEVDITPEQCSKKLWVELSGQTEYNILTDTTMKWNINKDYEQIFYSERFIDTLRVDVQYDENLRVIFTPVGAKDFQDIPTNGRGFVKVDNSILLPERGFRLIFVKQ